MSNKLDSAYKTIGEVAKILKLKPNKNGASNRNINNSLDILQNIPLLFEIV